MNIKQCLTHCFEQGLNGRQIDNCILSFAGNYISAEIPILAIKIDSLNELLAMRKDADNFHLLIERDIFYINALYKRTNNFPTPRIYYIKTHDLYHVGQIRMTLLKAGIQLPIISGEKFSELINEKNYPERVKIWLASKENRDKVFQNLVSGRIENTNLKEAIWLNSDTCLLCDCKDILMCTSTINVEEKILMIGFNLCQNHCTEAMDSETFLCYLCNKFEIPIPTYLTSLKPFNSAETISMSLKSIQEMECIIEKVDDKTVTALRKTGFRIIIRQENPNNYAYTVQDPNGKNVARIDSADHHKVGYGPDHVHNDLSKANKNRVEASFTCGVALYDIKTIKKLVEEAEGRYLNHIRDKSRLHE